MKRFIYALIITCLGAILIGLNTKELNPPLPEQPTQAIVEPLQATIEPVALPTPEPAQPIAVEPVQAPKPVEPTYSGDCSLVNNYTDWPTNVAYAVCKAESGGNVYSHNTTDNHGSCVGSYSLMQVGCFWYPYYGYSSADFYNPVVNIEIAHNIWKRQGGFNAWSAYTNNSYLKYMQ